MGLPTGDVSQIEDANVVSETPAPNAPPAPPAAVGAPAAAAPPPPPSAVAAPAAPAPAAAPAAPAAPPAAVAAPAPAPSAPASPPPAAVAAPAPAAVAAPAPAPAPAAAPAAEAPPAPANALVDAPAQTAVATTTGNPMVAAAAEQGFEGLDFDGFGAFPIISLKQGTFTSTDNWTLPDPFYAILQGSRKKFIYKNGLPDTDPDVQFFYTYDEVVAINGDSVEGILAEWKSKGWMFNKKPYLDVTMTLQGGEHQDKIVILSVPKTSISRLSAHWANMMATRKPLEAILTKIGKAPMVTSTKFDFTPIQFDVYNPPV